jgi:hypothetical protein
MTTESGLEASFSSPVPITFVPEKWETQLSITFPPFTPGSENGGLTAIRLSPDNVYVAVYVSFMPSMVPVHFPAPQTIVHLEITESDPIGVFVPFQLPETSASVSATAAAGGGAGAIAEAVSAGGVSVLAQATTAATVEIRINTRRITFPRLAAENGDVLASLHFGF